MSIEVHHCTPSCVWTDTATRETSLRLSCDVTGYGLLWNGEADIVGVAAGFHSTWGTTCWCPRVRRRQNSATGQDFWQATQEDTSRLVLSLGYHCRRAWSELWSESWQRRLGETSGSRNIIHQTAVRELAVKVTSSLCRLLTEACDTRLTQRLPTGLAAA